MKNEENQLNEIVGKQSVHARVEMSDSLILQAPIGFLLLTKNSFTIEIVNQKFLDITGFSHSEVINKPFYEIFPSATHLHNLPGALATLEVSEAQPLAIMHKLRHEEVFIQLDYKTISEAQGNPGGIIVVASDVSSEVAEMRDKELDGLRLKVAVEAAEIGTFEWDIERSGFIYSERLAKMFGYTDTGGLTHQSFTTLLHPDDEPVRSAAHRKALETGALSYEARFVGPDNIIRWIRLNGKVIYNAHHQPQKMYGTTTNVDHARSQTDKLEKQIQQRKSNLKKSYKELQKSEDRYHRMIDEVQDYAIILLNEEGIVQNWNKGAENIKQYKDTEIVGKSFRLFYQQSDLDSKLPERLLEQARTTGRAIHEGWRVRKDRTKFWGSVTLTALHDDEDNVIGFSKVTRDLTARKLAEDRLNEFAEELKQKNDDLRKSEERYQRMIREVQDYAIILLDDQGNIENWNFGAKKIKGYEAEEIIGKNFRVFYTEHDRKSGLPERLLAEARLNGRAVHEGLRIRKDGSEFWGSIVLTALHGNDNTVIGFSKVTRDLTDIKLAEDQLKKYLRALEIQNKDLEQFAYVASHDLQEPLRKIQTFSSMLELKLKDEQAAKKFIEKINLSAERMNDLIKSVLNYSRITDKEDVMVATSLNKILKNIEVDFELLIEEKGASLEFDALPTIRAIPLQINQLFSNLISNALKFNQQHPVIIIKSRVVPRSEIATIPDILTSPSYLEISVADNGIGFDNSYATKIFQMFQRLHGKNQYSGTGIGLALCKKIMEVHNGFITATSDGTGATFNVYFPDEILIAEDAS